MRQFSAGDISTEASKPTDLKFCVDIDFLPSAIALREIMGVRTYDVLADVALRMYLDDEAVEIRTKVTLDSLDKVVKKGLQMDMRSKDISSE